MATQSELTEAIVLANETLSSLDMDYTVNTILDLAAMYANRYPESYPDNKV